MPKKRILMGMVICVLMISISVVIITDKTSSHVVTKSDTSSDNEVSSLFAIMLETEAGSGEYQVSDNTIWPQSGYTYNATLSACENGSTLIWNEENKTVRLQANISDKCYIYFDVYVELTLANYIISEVYDEADEATTGLYYHDDDLSNGAGDYSYRYSGADPDNYVCFGYDSADSCPDDYLYRIIGLFDDNDDETYNVKLIKYDYANSNLLGTDGEWSSSTYTKSGFSTYKGNHETVNKYYWNNNRNTTVEDSTTYYNMWSDSALNTVNLNGNFLTNIGTEWSNLIASHNWKVGGMAYSSSYIVKQYYDVEVGTNSDATTYSAKIGLMYVSDYGFAADPSCWETALNFSNSSNLRANNWMHMGIFDWTISRVSDTTGDAFFVHSAGYVLDNYVTINANYNVGAIRPVFYLVSSVVLVSGSGTYSDPFIIS